VKNDEFHNLTGFDLEAVASRAIAKHLAAGLLEQSADGIRLTREGRFLADTVIVDLV
jgi:oxygen-independent coproporphyrinogen-3 oxidase